ncbi:MAG: hypothetical protein LC791_18890 [Acidobacteria bacterium]|nr:hypothetical protein [Acidobacteriota bacterium]
MNACSSWVSGLPAVGKATIARQLARSLAAVHVCIDSFEQVLRQTGLVVEGEGYAVAHAVAADKAVEAFQSKVGQQSPRAIAAKLGLHGPGWSPSLSGMALMLSVCRWYRTSSVLTAWFARSGNS